MIGMSDSSVARAAESTLDRKTDSFAEQGMASFFASKLDFIHWLDKTR